MKAKTILVALAIVAMVGVAYAQSTKPANQKTEARKSCYVDANKNGTCDKYESKRCKIGDGKCILDTNGKVKSTSKGKSLSYGDCEYSK